MHSKYYLVEKYVIWDTPNVSPKQQHEKRPMVQTYLEFLV